MCIGTIFIQNEKKKHAKRKKIFKITKKSGGTDGQHLNKKNGKVRNGSKTDKLTNLGYFNESTSTILLNI